MSIFLDDIISSERGLGHDDLSKNGVGTDCLPEDVIMRFDRKGSQSIELVLRAILRTRLLFVVRRKEDFIEALGRGCTEGLDEIKLNNEP